LKAGPKDRVALTSCRPCTLHQSRTQYHGGNVKPAVVTATWTGYKKAGPLLFSTEHRGTIDGKPLHLFFSDVSVKLTGSDKWVKAE